VSCWLLVLCLTGCWSALSWVHGFRGSIDAIAGLPEPFVALAAAFVVAATTARPAVLAANGALELGRSCSSLAELGEWYTAELVGLYPLFVHWLGVVQQKVYEDLALGEDRRERQADHQLRVAPPLVEVDGQEPIDHRRLFAIL